MPFIKWLFILCARKEKLQDSGKVVSFEVFKIIYLPLQRTACIFHLLIFLGKYSWVKQISPEVWLLLPECLYSLGAAHLGRALPHSRFKSRESPSLAISVLVPGGQNRVALSPGSSRDPPDAPCSLSLPRSASQQEFPLWV